jgi:isoleucyl-tRNA synthetase
MLFFKDVPAKVNFVEQEKEILKFWKETRAFQNMRALHQGQPRWSFIDGPITANNPMGVHHAWGRTYKDLFNRYKTMRGHELRYQNGFDCQGLWVEVEVEKELGFKTKKDIEAFGLAPFVLKCKQRVLNFAAVQTEQSVRLGMWMDWDDPEKLLLLREKLGNDPNAQMTLTSPSGRELSGSVEQVVGQLGIVPNGGSYFTFSDKNNYDIWMFLKTCYENGWIYKGRDSVPWCPRCETAISQHEILQEEYQNLTHKTVVVKFPTDEERVYLLAWTTTPWSIPGTIALMVHPDYDYVQVKQGEDKYILAEGRLAALKGAYQVEREFKGSELVGRTIVHPFREFPALQGQKFPVIPAKDFVTLDVGTGLVTDNPGVGHEDFVAALAVGLVPVESIDAAANFITGYDWLTGKNAKNDAVTDAILNDLESKGFVYDIFNYTHRYPVCWRCKTQLIFRMVDEWYIATDRPKKTKNGSEEASLRQRMLNIANQIRWIPEFGLERELDWLRNMHDWMISKKRYWGLALPIWECDNCGHFDMIGSRDELEERAVEGWDEFRSHTPHRPFIDAVKIACSNCGNKTSRIKDVGNPWLDAGIVSFSTMGYRSGQEYWKKWFPGDFITESFPGQFRNWFYSLLTMAAVLENKPAAKTILGFATLKAESGDAMHKSSGNMIEFNEAADSIGSDVMRWMYCNQRYDSDMLFGYHHADETRRHFFLPLWNVYVFFITYANLDGWKPDNRRQLEDAKSDLDRWILSRLHQVVGQVTAEMDDYQAYKATKPIEEFLDDLSNWYVRRSRRRFWKALVDSDKQAAYATLYEVLVTVCKLLAPFVPFVTEVMYQNLVKSVDSRAPESVHHCDWVRTDAGKIDKSLVAEMDAARRVVALGHAVRAESNFKVRQPLARALVVAPPDQRARVKKMASLVADELNVKELELVANESQLVTYNLLPDNRVLGPKFGARFPKVRAALAAADSARAVAVLRSGKNLALQLDGDRVELEPAHVLVTPQPKAGFAVKAEGDYVVALDTKMTDALRAEGLAREFVRHVQDLRKSAGFEIEDRIATYYAASDNLARALSLFSDYVRGETLSVELKSGSPPSGSSVVEDSFDGERVTLGISKSAKDFEGKTQKPVGKRAKGTKRAQKLQTKSKKSTRVKRNVIRKKRKV